MKPETRNIVQRMIDKKVMPSSFTTTEVVELIGDKSMHRSKIVQPEYREILGAKRKGAGLHFEFDAMKVLEFVVDRKKCEDLIHAIISLEGVSTIFVRVRNKLLRSILTQGVLT